MVSAIFKLYALGTLIVGYIYQIAYSPEYADWYDLEPKGLPVNLLGYATEKVMRRFSVDKRDVNVFLPDSKVATSWVKQTGPGGAVSYLSATDLKSRDHAEVYKYVVPQMEVDGNEDIVPVLRSFIEDLADGDARFEIKPSNMDDSTLDGIYRKQKRPWQLIGEFGHIHEEGSAHFILSVPDAREVLEKGWGERHGMSGRMLPLTYMFIYSPRNEEELREWKKIVKAAAAFMNAE